MQYLLTKDEYDELKAKADRADQPQLISRYDLQRLCSNYVTLYWKDKGGNFSCVNGEPRGIFPYCTDCPMLGICPSTSKEFPK